MSRVLLVDEACRVLTPTTGKTAPPHEAFQVVWVDAPDRSDLDAKGPLGWQATGERTPVTRGVEPSLDNRKWM